MAVKFVVVEQINFGRSTRAKPGLSFGTEVEAKAWIEKLNEKYRKRFHVEGRKVKDIDASQTMHCQCCGRAIHAAKGAIAHHGYTRPGDGWQTASCFGAKYAPWEVSRLRVKDLIEHLEQVLGRSIVARDGVHAETLPVTHHYQVYDRKVRGGYRFEKISMTRDTFEIVKAANPDKVFSHTPSATFDEFKKRDLEKRNHKIAQLKRDITEFTLKYDGWTQTHKREGDKWVAL